MLYFAYGSNLSSARMASRVPSARVVARVQLRGHALRFHKVGRDGSAKCNACFTGSTLDATLGLVYRIPTDEKKYLDAAEGLGNGYEIKRVCVVSFAGDMLEAFTYTATRIAPGLKPFHWYREHVLRGAREHGFPDQYVRTIEAVASVEDVDRIRTGRELEIYAVPSSSGLPGDQQ
jgi:gamma-glutamylcyclotransferase